MKRIALWLLIAVSAVAQNTAFEPPNVQGVGITAKLNEAMPLDTVFHDESGASVSLRAYFHGKPVLIAPVYFTCPMLCSQILSGVVAGLRPLSLEPGRDFEIVAISFDPHDTPALAREERDHYSRSYSSRAGVKGWHFLTGSQDSIHAVTEALGFRYKWDAAHKMFIHPSGVMVVTPDGKISRYLYGVEYEPKDLKLSLIEASSDQIGSPTDQVLLLCYHYDPKTGKYGAAVLGLLRGAGILTLIVMGAALAFLWRKDLRTYSGKPGAARV